MWTTILIGAAIGAGLAGQMTDDSKKIAAMTMASLGIVISAAAKEVMQESALARSLLRSTPDRGLER